VDVDESEHWINKVTPWCNALKKSTNENKSVTDSKGGDTLLWTCCCLLPVAGLLMLKDGASLKGIFTMRSRKDADDFKKACGCGQGGKVIIVGGAPAGY
jgi:ferredoxin-nitrate reductase